MCSSSLWWIPIKSFTEDESLRLTLSDSFHLNEFDQNYQNVYLLTHSNVLERRSVFGDRDEVMSIKLEHAVKDMTSKQMSLSDDGKWCVIGAGMNKPYFYLIDTVKERQFTLESKALAHTVNPSFIEGGRVVIGGIGRFEVWDIETKSLLRAITDFPDTAWFNCSFSVNNVLAAGFGDHVLRLYDTSTWNLIYSSPAEMSLIHCI